MNYKLRLGIVLNRLRLYRDNIRCCLGPPIRKIVIIAVSGVSVLRLLEHNDRDDGFLLWGC